MAILKNGLFGAVSGRLGNTVIYQKDNKMFVRMIGKRKAPLSENELANRFAFGVVMGFLKVMRLLINVGFAVAAKSDGMYPMNKAVSVNRKWALTGSYPDVEIDYARALLSFGSLYGLAGPSVVLEGNALNFSWEVDVSMGWPYAIDQVMVLAYFPDLVLEEGSGLQKAYFSLNAALRKSGHASLDLPDELVNERMEVYVTVVSNDKLSASMSQYLGRLN
ncbi:MAG TPA: DUF6266 family protein [Pedobacter sp.]|uniref:DUF6266 family protein n=1 Tax=Pedobacter sp. TaxID=1411316 RepID=UPI002BE1BB96|nr:DUF6266 family protein [Pedobacter sp.]HMI03129.1 DUF6266 family protein [Pedobacter sp.]